MVDNKIRLIKLKLQKKDRRDARKIKMQREDQIFAQEIEMQKKDRIFARKMRIQKKKSNIRTRTVHFPSFVNLVDVLDLVENHISVES